MIVRPAETYRLTAEKHGLPQELVSSIGASVFTRLMEVMTDPQELAYELDHVGTFHVRHLFFKKRLALARHMKWEGFIQKYEHMEAKIDNFKRIKTDFKIMKDEYKKNKALQSSQD